MKKFITFLAFSFLIVGCGSANTSISVPGNLSLTPLFEIASRITEATRNDDGVNLDEEIAELKETYVSIEEAYKKYIAVL